MNELHTQVCFDALSVLNNVQYVESGMILISNVIFLKFFCTSLGLSKKYIYVRLFVQILSQLINIFDNLFHIHWFTVCNLCGASHFTGNCPEIKQGTYVSIMPFFGIK